MKHDVVALVAGLLLTGVAACALWYTYTERIDWQVLRVGAPLALVVVGVLGLTLSRNRR
jgi:uncharacterized membrane protein (DUF4010 family)